MTVLPCLAFAPSLVSGEEPLRTAQLRGRRLLGVWHDGAERTDELLAREHLHFPRLFYRGQELGRGDLSFYLGDWPIESVTYTLMGPLSVPHGHSYVIGPRDRIPVNPAPGEYYPALQVPPTALPGEYQIRWSVRLENGELRAPIQPFWIA